MKSVFQRFLNRTKAPKQQSSLRVESLEERMMLSSVQVFAAGTTGNEVIELEIDGAVVATFDQLGASANENQFIQFDYSTPDLVAADNVRINFTNDLYDPDNGIDRNVRIDAIVIDGQRFETEATDVFSTGTWSDADGITPGFRQSEYLHANGYLQYAGEAVVPGEPPNVVINEIFYNPSDELDGDAEFLELYNAGDTVADLSGMSFTGFTLTFAAGTTLGAGEYATVAPSVELAQSTFGVTPIAEFESGGLSGGGETIQLIAADGETIVDEVTYDDATPWPGAPDGDGPSLELVNPSLDNSLASNWSASEGVPTPGAQNSVFAAAPNSGITNITVSDVQPGQSFSIDASIDDAAFANLIYRIGFGDEVTLQMTNVGGNQWSVSLPGQDAGALVRYRIESDVAVAPFDSDTINYLGLVVNPTDITGNTLPVFHWFIDQDEFQTLVTDDFLTNRKIEAVVAYGDQVIDNATVRVRGNYSRQFVKKGFKFELPRGYLLDFGDLAQTPVDEFGIVTDFGDSSVASAQISWEIWNAETQSQTSTFFTRVEQNGDFYGVYRFQELYDGTWRTANGFKDGEFYQAEEGGWNTSEVGFDQKEPGEEDYTNIHEVRDILFYQPSSWKTEWVYDNVDVPEMINYMALSSLTRHTDQYWHNYYVARDGSTGRWSQVEWDFDLTWRDVYVGIPAVGDDVTTPDVINSALMNAVWEVPEFQAMYWTRLQTLVDRYLGDDSLVDRRLELVDEIGATNSALEAAAWDRDDIVASSFYDTVWQQTIDARQAVFASESRLPGATDSDASVVINELHYNPANNDAEFIELFNTSNQAVDLSGWEIDGVGLTINYGTVILPGEYIVFSDGDTQLREQSAGTFLVAAEYSGGLSGGGETISLFNSNGDLIDEVSYDDAGDWVTSPDGDGFTLSLIAPALDNSLASSWVASNEINGTPGAANNVSGSDSSTISIFAAGASANEVVELEVNGIRVASFNIGDNGGNTGDYSSREFTELTWVSDGAVSLDDVRVYFVNDRYDPDNGIDYNVRIDKINIDGVDYQSESSNTFASGVWIDDVGITSGFLQKDRLNANGFFQYQV